MIKVNSGPFLGGGAIESKLNKFASIYNNGGEI